MSVYMEWIGGSVVAVFADVMVKINLKDGGRLMVQRILTGSFFPNIWKKGQRHLWEKRNPRHRV